MFIKKYIDIKLERCKININKLNFYSFLFYNYNKYQNILLFFVC